MRWRTAPDPAPALAETEDPALGDLPTEVALAAGPGYRKQKGLKAEQQVSVSGLTDYYFIRHNQALKFDPTMESTLIQDKLNFHS